MEYITLNNGVKMPLIGFGVFRITDTKECEENVYQAIKAGYRLIDTAAAYENEEAVGRAIKRSGVPREELFVTTKLWITDTNYQGAKKGLQNSLKRLALDYVDLYLIHQPYNDCYGAWRAMEEMYSEGKVRAIGVDNFTQERLADFIMFNKVKPAINMIEVNPFYQRQKELEYMKEKGVQMEAWSPLGAGKESLFQNEILLSLSRKYNKSIPQVILRWLLQRGIVSVVKTSNLKRMNENIDIFDFKISDDEMKVISSIDTNQSCFDLRVTGNEVEKFLNYAKTLNV